MKIKKIISLGVISSLLLINTSASFALNFKDVSSNAWYMSALKTLVSKDGIQGYDDGTFKPNNVMKQGEFIKTVVATVGDVLPIAKGEHWAMNYVREAEKLGYLDKGEFGAYTLEEPINRYKMAKILVRVVEGNGEKFEGDINKYSTLIKDFNIIPEEYKPYVLKAYSRGLLAGYTEDSTFKGDRHLNRAEATTVVVRIFDKTERVDPDANFAEIKPIKEIIKNPEMVNESGIFNITHVKILKDNPYRMELSEGLTSVAIRTYSDGIGVIALVKDGEVLERTQRVSTKDHVTHILTKGTKKEDLKKYDYIAMYQFRDEVMLLIPNPFR